MDEAACAKLASVRTTLALAFHSSKFLYQKDPTFFSAKVVGVAERELRGGPDPREEPVWFG